MICELQLNMLNYHEGSTQATSKIFGIPVTLFSFYGMCMFQTWLTV